MINIIPFKSAHAEYILSQELNDKKLELAPQHKKYAMYLEYENASFTAIVNGKPIAAGGIFVLWDNVAEMYLEYENASFTAIVNGKPIAAGGIFILWDNVAEGWVLATSEIWNYKLTMAKIFKKRTDVLVKENKIKRLQTAVKADFELGHKFAQFLGLEKEGLMKHYGPDGSDYIRYARIIK